VLLPWGDHAGSSHGGWGTGSAEMVGSQSGEILTDPACRVPLGGSWSGTGLASRGVAVDADAGAEPHGMGPVDYLETAAERARRTATSERD